jgi:hypothetical protein
MSGAQLSDFTLHFFIRLLQEVQFIIVPAKSDVHGGFFRNEISVVFQNMITRVSNNFSSFVSSIAPPD